LLVLSSVACRGLLEMRHGMGNIRIAGNETTATLSSAELRFKRLLIFP
jgi:hypothetical protein